MNFDGIFVIFDGKQHFGRKIAMGFFNRKKSENQELRHLGRRELVAREAKKGGFEEPVRVEVGDGKIEYEADHFSKMINGVE